jgi:hypothetical protein
VALAVALVALAVAVAALAVPAAVLAVLAVPPVQAVVVRVVRMVLVVQAGVVQLVAVQCLGVGGVALLVLMQEVSEEVLVCLQAGAGVLPVGEGVHWVDGGGLLLDLVQEVAAALVMGVALHPAVAVVQLAVVPLMHLQAVAAAPVWVGHQFLVVAAARRKTDIGCTPVEPVEQRSRLHYCTAV